MWGRKITLLLISLLLTLVGCSEKDHKEFEYKEMEYRIIDTVDYPGLVQEEINDFKISPFQFAYSDGDNLYIAVGYGEQSTGGYSVIVKHVGQSDNKIFVETTLIEPSQEEDKVLALSYPYVVIQLKDKGLEVEYSTHF